MKKAEFDFLLSKGEDYKTELRLGEKLGEKLGENQAKIIQYMQEDNKISIVQIAERIGISTTAVENNIKKLQERGIIKRIGPDNANSPLASIPIAASCGVLLARNSVSSRDCEIGLKVTNFTIKVDTGRLFNNELQPDTCMA